MERLQRVLASAGVASRRRSEELILEGRVRVDGEIITELGSKVDPAIQKIEVDGKLIPTVRRRYILLNKPSGYITTTSDERSRYTVMDLVPVNERVVPVGRLDRQTEGLLLLTNDGEVANRVMHPRYGIDKEYEALLDGYPPPEVLDRLRRGITIDGQRTTPEMIRPIRNTEDGTIVRIVIHEGRNRIVRKMFDEVGYPVTKLIRTRVGPLQLGAIPRGTFRDLTDGELKVLREALHMTDEDVTFAERVADRPLRDRPDPNRMKTGRPRETNVERGARGPGGPPRRDDRRGPARPARDGQRSGPPRPRRDDEQGRSYRPTRDGQFAGPPQARGDGDPRRSGPPRPARDGRPGAPAGPRRDRRDAAEDRRPARRDDDQRGQRSGQQNDRPSRTRDDRDGDRRRTTGRPEQRDDSRRPARGGPAPGGQRRDRPAGPPRGGSRPAGPGGARRGPGGPPRGPRPGPGGQGPRPRRDNDKTTGGAGGGGERPPDDNRDRRAGGGGQEHGRRDRRPED